MKYNHKIILLAAFAATTLQVSAQEEADSVASEQVPVAFGAKQANETLGGVSTVNVKQLTEKNYNTYALDNMQGYIGGFNGASLWGYTDYLVLVDGTPRDINNVKPDEIEQISFLKGAQAIVLYGSRAANGVVLITTKRGQESPLRIDVRINTGWDVAKSYPEYLSSAEYMTLYNEARRNDGLSPLYSAQDIYNYGSGQNPYRYPNVDFYSSDYVKKTRNRTEAIAEISGGGHFAKFYTNIGYYRTGDYLKFGEAENNFTQRFNVRGNVDLRLNDIISAFVNANVSFYDSKSPVGDNYWEKATSLRPNRVAPLIPASYLDVNAIAAQDMLATTTLYDGSFLAATQADRSNVFAQYYAAGSSKYTSRQFQFDAGINFDLSGLLKGLSLHTQFSVDYSTSYSTSFNDEFATWAPTWSNYNGEDKIVALTKFNEDKHSGVQNVSGSTDNQVMSFNAHFDYVRTFKDVHNVDAKFVVNGFQLTNSGEYHKKSNANLGLMLAYNYNHKYFANFSAAVVHSSRLAEGHREAFSPSFSLGWNLAREKFLEGGIFDDLMLSASYSVLNTDLGIDDYYMYKGYYTQDGAWWGWYDGQSIQSVNVKRGWNEDLTFLKRKEFSVNLKASLFKKMITLDASFFHSKKEGGVIRADGSYPSYFFTYYPEATFLPNINYNDDSRTGFDFAINFNKKIGQVELQAGLTGTYYTTKATKRDDINYVDAYQHREGKPLDAIWGYECLGYFDKKDFKWDADGNIAGFADGVPNQSKLSGNIRPGDLKYKDQNGDGLVDEKDQVNLAKGGWYGNPFTMGINLTAKYKGFTLFILGTGGFGAKAVKGNIGTKSGNDNMKSYYWISGEDKYSAVVRDRVQYAYDANGEFIGLANPNAAYPRLTTQSGANNNTTSDFWLYSTDAFRLTKVQLSYDFPQKWFQRTIIRGLSAYVSGSNLLTIAKERELLELNVGSAPQTRFYNLGVKVSF